MKSILFVLASLTCSQLSGAVLSAPTETGLSHGETVTFRLTSCPNLGSTSLTVNDLPGIQPQWSPGDYPGVWLRQVSFSAEQSKYQLVVDCSSRQHSFSGIVSQANPDAIAQQVMDRFLKIHPQWTWAWNWGPAVLNHGLLEFAEVAESPEYYIGLASRFQSKHRNTIIPFLVADLYAGAYPGYHLQRQYGDFNGERNLARVIKILREAPRNAIGSLNHYGHNKIINAFVPESIWVDSLMMWGLLAFEYGLYENDLELLDFALEQTEIFRSYLQDTESGLFYHAYNIPQGELYPVDNTFWLRGNGWVAYAFAKILEQLPVTNQHYEGIALIFQKHMMELLSLQGKSGLWDTLIYPGKAYLESSGSALIASSFLKGFRLGLLSEDYKEAGLKTFQSITGHLKKRKDGYTMEMISLGTNPGNEEDYRRIRRDRNVNYGVGAYFTLLAEVKRLHNLN